MWITKHLVESQSVVHMLCSKLFLFADPVIYLLSIFNTKQTSCQTCILSWCKWHATVFTLYGLNSKSNSGSRVVAQSRQALVREWSWHHQPPITQHSFSSRTRRTHSGLKKQHIRQFKKWQTKSTIQTEIFIFRALRTADIDSALPNEMCYGFVIISSSLVGFHRLAQRYLFNKPLCFDNNKCLWV